MNNIERRNFDVAELRSVEGEGGKKKLVGYAAVFNSEARISKSFREKIAPGAFAETIKADDIRALWNHNDDYPLGRNKAGTLLLSEDERGLKIEIDPPETQWANDLRISIDRGDISQMSFGFRTIKDSWEQLDEETEIRTLEKVMLYDVSPVTFPAYEDTEIALRSLAEYRKANGVFVPDHNLIKEEDEALRLMLGL